MKRIKNPNAFLDIKSILDTAIEKGGLRWELDSHGAAVKQRQRCYSFRAAFRRAEEARLKGVLAAVTPYDNLKIVFEGDESTSSILLITFHSAKGKFTDMEGNPIVPGETDAGVTEDMIPQDFADFVANLEGDKK